MSLFLKNVIRLQGLFEDITSNRGYQFVPHFRRSVLQTFDIFVNLSLANHPQIDGQNIVG